MKTGLFLHGMACECEEVPHRGRDDNRIAGYDELEGGNMAKWKEGKEMKRPV